MVLQVQGCTLKLPECHGRININNTKLGADFA